MSPVTHFLTGWVVANSSPSFTTKERAMVTLASVIPDIDGFGAIPEILTRNSAHPLQWFSLYHHQLHNIGFGLLVAVAFSLTAKHRVATGLLTLLSFHLHLIEDLVGARGPDGYQWPIPYLLPFSRSVEITWRGQWALNAWPNFAITLLLLLATFYMTLVTGHSPLEMFSHRADRSLVAALRHRFPRRSQREHS